MVNKTNVQYSIENGVNLLVDTVKLTLGPKGNTVILFDGAGKAFPTKDGITVASNIHSEDECEEAAIQILREASSKTAELAGDGTTTSLVLAQAIYKAGKKALKRMTLPQLKAELELAVEECKRLLRTSDFTRQIPFDKEHLSYVATTSANNDKSIGELIANAFISVGPEGTVSFDTEDVVRTYVETLKGSRYKLPIASKEFYNKKGSLEAKYENPYILLFDNAIKDINSVAPAIMRAAKDNKAIAIFANDFSELALSQMYANLIQNTVQIVPIKVTGYVGYRKDILSDLAALTEAKVVDKVVNDAMLGKCDIISSSVVGTVISVNNPSAEYNAKIKEIQENIDTEKDSIMKGQYRERLNQLKGKIAIIHVGGATEAEQKERYDRVEDAVCAVNAAIEEGISMGGGSTFVRLSREMHGISTILEKALLSPYIQLCINSNVKPQQSKIDLLNGYNFLNSSFENLYESGVIDPTKVIRLCIEHAVSVAILLLSTKAIVFDEQNQGVTFPGI